MSQTNYKSHPKASQGMRQSTALLPHPHLNVFQLIFQVTSLSLQKICSVQSLLQALSQAEDVILLQIHLLLQLCLLLKGKQRPGFWVCCLLVCKKKLLNVVTPCKIIIIAELINKHTILQELENDNTLEDSFPFRMHCD